MLDRDGEVWFVLNDVCQALKFREPPVYEADPDGRPVVHHRTVHTLGVILRAGTISKDMHDAARDFQAQFTIACYDTLVSCAFSAIRRKATGPS